MTSHNGIQLGANSPILTPAGARRKLQASEEDMQIALMQLLVGPVVNGQPRQPGGGMTTRYPELALVYAIPNGGARHKATAGRMKAQGVLKSMPDLHLPVMRGPFLTLYIEFKRPGDRSRSDQRAMADALRAEGHAVIECRGVEEGLSTILGYLALDKNRPSVRPLHGSGPIDEQLKLWRAAAMALIAPKRRGDPL